MSAEDRLISTPESVANGRAEVGEILDKVASGTKCHIIFCSADKKTRHKLETLGLVTGSKIGVISNTGAGLILKVKDSRLAISHGLARQLTVRQG